MIDKVGRLTQLIFAEQRKWVSDAFPEDASPMLRALNSCTTRALEQLNAELTQEEARAQQKA